MELNIKKSSQSHGNHLKKSRLTKENVLTRVKAAESTIVFLASGILGHFEIPFYKSCRSGEVSIQPDTMDDRYAPL